LSEDSHAGQHMSLATRVLIVLVVLAAEKTLLNSFVDPGGKQAAKGLAAPVAIAAHFGFRFAVTFVACLVLFGYMRGNQPLVQINETARGIPVRARWLFPHVALLLLLVPLSYFLYGDRDAPLPFPALAGLWILFALAGIVALSTAMAPWSLWRGVAKSLGNLWVYAAAVAVAASCALQWSQVLWRPTARVTFELVRGVLAPVVPTLSADPAHLILSSDRFAVQIADVCSGLEGVGLMLAFFCVWLWVFRKEYIFPRALLLIPAGILLIFALNVLRIAALVLIGHAGYPDVAAYGFHSQAGWLAFNCAAAGAAFVSRRSVWLSHTARSDLRGGDNPTAAYLLPFLALLAAAMLARAASGGFETLYPLRLFAGAFVFWLYWPKLRTLDWRFSWRGPVAGVVAFALWMCASYLLETPSAMPSALTAMPPSSRTLWIAARLATTVIAVPIAEELAYRGYLLRRIVAADFESVRFESVGLWPLLFTSLAFGLTHGSMWLSAIAVGAIYGATLMWTGRLGEAVAAHATTNGLLAGVVLLWQQWQLW